MCSSDISDKVPVPSDNQTRQPNSRQTTVEPVFGQIKETRGIRRFPLRGLLNVASEWKLICATHNLLKLFRYRIALAPA
jgi:hypothetical protein